MDLGSTLTSGHWAVVGSGHSGRLAVALALELDQFRQFWVINSILFYLTDVVGLLPFSEFTLVDWNYLWEVIRSWGLNPNSLRFNLINYRLNHLKNSHFKTTTQNPCTNDSSFQTRRWKMWMSFTLWTKKSCVAPALIRSSSSYPWDWDWRLVLWLWCEKQLTWESTVNVNCFSHHYESFKCQHWRM